MIGARHGFFDDRIERRILTKRREVIVPMRGGGNQEPVILNSPELSDRVLALATAGEADSASPSASCAAGYRHARPNGGSSPPPTTS
jgi:hypothetical protein